MRVGALTPTDLDISFDGSQTALDTKRPKKYTFLRSARCKVLTIIGLLLIAGVIAVLATSYTIALKATQMTTASTTTTTENYQIITQINDTITGIYNASVGGSSLPSTLGNGVGQYLSGEDASACIDFADTICMNFGNVGLNISGASNSAGVGTGVYTILIIGASIVRSIQFQTTNNSANRDPLTITLEGSNVAGTSLSSGSSWTFIYSGATGLSPLSISRSAWGDPQKFSNSQSYTAYRIIITSQRGSDYCTEFTEMHLYGII